MSWLPESQDRLPLTWWKGQPVFLAAIMALVGVGSMVVTAVMMAADARILPALIFTWSNIVDHYRVWTPFTYVFVNPPSIWLVLSSYFLWRFGEEVERHLGRRVFIKLVSGLILVAPLLLSLIALVGGSRDWPAVGITQTEFGVFLAFATLYPRAKLSIIIATIDAWVMAVILVGVSALQDLAYRNWAGLFILASQVLFAYGYIRYEQGHWTLPSLSMFNRKRRRRKSAPRSNLRENPNEDEGSESDEKESRVDEILEKIHRHGLQSLTEKERRVMQQASEDLRKGGTGTK